VSVGGPAGRLHCNTERRKRRERPFDLFMRRYVVIKGYCLLPVGRSPDLAEFLYVWVPVLYV
jgi:hypothetical protein